VRGAAPRPGAPSESGLGGGCGAFLGRGWRWSPGPSRPIRPPRRGPRPCRALRPRWLRPAARPRKAPGPRRGLRQAVWSPGSSGPRRPSIRPRTRPGISSPGPSGSGGCCSESRSGAPCRCFHWPVSPDRFPHRTCASRRIRRSTSPVGRGDSHAEVGHGPGIFVPRYRYHAVVTLPGSNRLASPVPGHQRPSQ